MLIPQAFTYILMKLGAYRDRMNDDDKDFGRHHALDIYRIVGLMTEDEDNDVRQLRAELADHPTVVEARDVAMAHFVSPDGIGRLRIQEHQLYNDAVDLDRLAKELEHLFAHP